MVDDVRLLFARCQALSLSGRIAGLVGPQEAVSHTAPVNVGSLIPLDPATWVVAYGEGALAGASARPKR
jgi:hypothetical protein